jgi:hypothetical protein
MNKTEIEQFLLKLSEDEGRTFPEIVDAINKGEIKIDCNGHNVVHMGESRAIEYFKKDMNDRLEQREKTAKALPDNPISLGNLYSKMKPGDIDMNMEAYCWDCGARMYGVLIDDNTWSYVPSDKYWKIADTKPDKYNVNFTKEDLKSTECPLFKQLGNERKIVTEIEVPSGNLIFANYFENNETYESKEHREINDVKGRMDLMKHLAKKNIGYGQMGNMSITIYSNKKEVIIGDNLECYEDNKCYHDSNPDTVDDYWLKEVEQAEAYKKMLKDGKFKEKGEISLSVWRWQCGDKQILEEQFGEKFPGLKKDDKSLYSSEYVWIGVEPGTWVIEHYYDFPENGDYLYSKLYKK